MFHISVASLHPGTILTPGLWGKKTAQIRTSNYAQYTKEEIFEDIRKSHFPGCPSRLSAIFLFPDITSAYFYRANWMKYQAHIYEVDVLSGTPFVAEMDLLNCNGAEFRTIQSNAEKYWRQLQHAKSQTLESILDGQARVQALVAVPSVL